MLNFTIILNIINLAKIKLLLENGQPGPVRVVHVVVAHVTRTIDVTPVSIVVVEVVRGPKPKAILLLRHNPRLNFMFNPIFFPLIYLSVNFLLRRLAKGFSRGLSSDKRTAPTSLFPYSIKNGEVYDPSPEANMVPGFKETDGRAPLELATLSSLTLPEPST